ncbi:hypothetical protein HYH03_017151 [Edaphochlamys debaryana]|uniref:F-box/LRR-repeat protein 15-like leucin rich repeat domain-containing protein n=1 Tax=Edaphochlamys debaryana TaxID=47281 RepID=A0A836BQP6_9CHLO|nr:hypothetical protein HYH03_017151 [Edaphochlamys debaryana]|eukprot:KAG2483984.1 hypothetical protein HYH03_017151 [Edaphochlamys debaryana]
MAPKKRAREPAADNAGDGAAAAAPGGGDAASRRDGMADIARKRAAHFANFADDDEARDDNVHTGTGEARTLGPWSSAVQLVNARGQAQQDRKARLQQQQQAAREAEDALAEAADWEPSRDPSLGPHPRCPVPPLFATCLGVLTAWVECVESLEGVPDAIRVRLAASVCAQRKMSPEVSRLFSGGSPSPSEVSLPDCTQLDAGAMGALLGEVAGPRLQRLELGFCGRGLGDEAAARAAAAGPLGELEVLELGGAYRLGDGGLGTLLAACPALQRLSLPQAPRLTGGLLLRLPDWTPKLTHLNLADCRGVGADALVAALPRLPGLRSLRLDAIPEVDDSVLSAAALLPALTHLGLRCCTAVTDAGLTALAAGRGGALQGLTLDECGGRVTDAGVAALAGQCVALRSFSARRCTRLGDAALASLLRAGGGTMERLALSGVPGVGPGVAGALASACRDSLVGLDVSFCRKLPDRAMGLLLSRCTRLRRLVVYGCSQLSARSLYGHDNAHLVVEGQHTKVDLDLTGGGRGGKGVMGEGGKGEEKEKEEAKEEEGAEQEGEGPEAEETGEQSEDGEDE